MKKLGYLLLILFVISGCSKQGKIVIDECTFSMEQGSSLIDATYLFESNETTKNMMKQESTVIFTVGTIDEVENLTKTFERFKKEYTDAGIDYSYSIDGLKMTEKMTIDYDVVAIADLVKLNIIEQMKDEIPTVIDVDSSIERLVNQGFTCIKK